MRGPLRVIAAGALTICGSCRDGAHRSVIRAPDEDAHLWDTEDPGAAIAPTILLVLAAVAGAAAILGRLIAARRDHGRLRLTPARRTQLLVLHRPIRVDHPPAGDPVHLAQFPAWVSEKALVATVERIASDAHSYASGAIPAGPGLYVAQVRMAGPKAASVIVKVVVDPVGGEVIAAHPSRDPDRITETGPHVAWDASPVGPGHHVRSLLEQARTALPAAAEDYATRNPHHPDSIATLAYARELMDLGEWEVALYAIAEIARRVQAGPECWRAVETAASALRFDALQLRRISRH